MQDVLFAFSAEPVVFGHLEEPEDSHSDNHARDVGQDDIADQLVPPALSENGHRVFESELEDLGEDTPDLHVVVVSEKEREEDPAHEVVEGVHVHLGDQVTHLKSAVLLPSLVIISQLLCRRGLLEVAVEVSGVGRIVTEEHNVEANEADGDHAGHPKEGGGLERLSLVPHEGVADHEEETAPETISNVLSVAVVF